MKVKEAVIVDHGEYGNVTKGVDLTDSEKQFILYTKNHFERSEDVTDDLRVFAGRNYGYAPEHANMGNVMYFVTQLFTGLISANYILTEGKDPVQYLIDNIVKYNLQRDDHSLLKFLMGRIQGVYVDGLDLGEPDSSYLELKK